MKGLLLSTVPKISKNSVMVLIRIIMLIQIGWIYCCRALGLTHNHSVSLSGGTEAARYSASLAYYNQAGLVKNTDHNRYNVRFNLDSKVTDWLKFGMNTSMSRRDILSPTNPFSGGLNQIFRQANRIPNSFVNKYTNGTYGRHIDGNPIAWIEAGGKATSKYSHVLGSCLW